MTEKLYTHFVPFDLFLEGEPIQIDMAYQNADHPRNIFKAKLYHDDARCWAYKDLAAITILAARIVSKRYEWQLQIKDCLRSTNSQAAMAQTDIVKANPQWMVQPRLLAPPGAGAHPRAMAVDVCALYSDGSQANMGTPFDWMEPSSARDYTDLHADHIENRKKLEQAFIQSAEYLKQDFIPYPSEWWDFRYSSAYYTKFDALSDKDLPSQMQMTHKIENDIKNLPLSHFETLAEEIRILIDNADENF